MKVPISWLKDYVNINIDSKEYADIMTMSGSKVEGVIKLFENIKNVVVGQIIDIFPHENADNLVVCNVNVGKEMVQVVTGAKNVKVNDYVPVALDEAVLSKGLKIKKGNIRGVISEGMLYSLGEIELTIADYPDASEDGIFILDGEYKLGQDIADALKLREEVVEFEITSNRPDCLSIKGLALESSVALGVEYAPVVVDIKEEGKPTNEYIKVEIKDDDLCPLYVARVCTDVKIKPSPEWMRKRLRAAGVRPINNVVDITNYVMLEYGQPMHAFDIEYIKGGKIIVRRAKALETITTLDEIVRILTYDDLVIADEEKAIALAGVMGCENSEIKEFTKTVIFESAIFEPSHVRLTSKKVGLRTESSSRFEKGLDPENAINAIDRACQLMELLEAGIVCKGSVKEGTWKKKKNVVAFDDKKINKLLGSEIKREYMKEILEKLQFEVFEDHVLVPCFRADVVIEEDISEEIARFFDYNSIKPTLPQSTTSGGGLKTRTQKIRGVVKEALTSLGYYEGYTFSFNSPKIYEKLNIAVQPAVKIINPLGEDFSIMRTTSFDGILKSLSINFNRRVKEASLFELAKIYILTKDEELPLELEEVTLGIYGNCDFYDLKGSFESLIDLLGIVDYDFETETQNTTFHPGRCAKIIMKGIVTGVFGQISPIVAQNYELPRETFIGVIDFDTLCSHALLEKEYSKLPRYPSINRDLALVLDKDIEAARVEKIIKDTGGSKLETIELFDIYIGEQIGENKKSLAYSLIWRDMEKTLNEDDISEPMEKILNRLNTELGAELRKV